jgi:hypothetical protein
MPTISFTFTTDHLTEVKGAVASDMGVLEASVDDATVKEWMSSQVRTIVMAKRRTDAAASHPASPSNLPI